MSNYSGVEGFGLSILVLVILGLHSTGMHPTSLACDQPIVSEDRVEEVLSLLDTVRGLDSGLEDRLGLLDDPSFGLLGLAPQGVSSETFVEQRIVLSEAFVAESPVQVRTYDRGGQLLELDRYDYAGELDYKYSLEWAEGSAIQSVSFFTGLGGDLGWRKGFERNADRQILSEMLWVGSGDMVRSTRIHRDSSGVPVRVDMWFATPPILGVPGNDIAYVSNVSGGGGRLVVVDDGEDKECLANVEFDANAMTRRVFIIVDGEQRCIRTSRLDQQGGIARQWDMSIDGRLKARVSRVFSSKGIPVFESMVHMDKDGALGLPFETRWDSSGRVLSRDARLVPAGVRFENLYSYSVDERGNWVRRTDYRLDISGAGSHVYEKALIRELEYFDG